MVEELREWARNTSDPELIKLLEKAAKKIEELEDDVDRLREDLEWF